MTENQESALQPNLELIPEWALWIAQDADGAWWAYETEPNQQDQGWYENEVGRIARLGQTTPPTDWRTTLKKL
ncbi:MAG: hypothetical protein Q8L39_14970 [Burkholderiales bacterium]|nr:hypothetical protein [Burkholderiales bacterium]